MLLYRLINAIPMCLQYQTDFPTLQPVVFSQIWTTGRTTPPTIDGSPTDPSSGPSSFSLTQNCLDKYWTNQEVIYNFKGVHPLRSLSISVLLLSRTEVDVQFGPLSLRSFASSVLSTDLDIHFGPYIAISVLLLIGRRSFGSWTTLLFETYHVAWASITGWTGRRAPHFLKWGTCVLSPTEKHQLK